MMADVVEFRPRTPGTKIIPLGADNVVTWGIGVQRDGSLVLTVIGTDGLPRSFFIDHSLVDQFENSVSVAAKHSREITGG